MLRDLVRLKSVSAIRWKERWYCTVSIVLMAVEGVEVWLSLLALVL